MSARFDPSLLPKSPNLEFEKSLWVSKIRYVAGIDEVGRGALAGPVAVGALILPPNKNFAKQLAGVRDSKELTPGQREFLAKQLEKTALAWGVGFATNEEIDTLGILPATRLAGQRALAALAIKPEHLLLDYLFLPEVPQPQTSLIKGDSRCLSIAGASILAKTTRDALMREFDSLYPGFGFASHKGYYTPGHAKALKFYGPTPIHRKSFRPIVQITKL